MAAACRVGICDDVDAYRQVLGIVLGVEPGLELVGEASNGQEAIDLVDREDVDVLLLDISMPEMDGLEALPLVRAASPRTKVVMLTGYGSEVTRRRAMELGASLYLEKGASPSGILDAIRKVHDAPHDAQR
jgi:DNA-binding NarL/FixJ family response regulator